MKLISHTRAVGAGPWVLRASTLRGIDHQSQLGRALSLRGAVALNMLDMIGVGPFITLPLLLSAMGGPQAMLGWVLGAVLALCDGMVWAELGAMMPEAGGSYRYLRSMFPGSFGRMLSFVFVFQLMFSAPLSVASGAIGLSQYATYIFPGVGGTWLHAGRVSVGPGTLIAMGTVLIAVALLYRSLTRLRFISYALWACVIGTLGWIFVVALLHGHLHAAFDLPPNAFRLTPAFFSGLASAMLVATYDFWGYYNVAFLGAEVKDPTRTIPRAILLSIVIVAGLYLCLNIAVLAVVPWRPLVAMKDLGARQALISFFMQTAYGGEHGLLFGKLVALLIMVAAFGSIFSLLLGYSRIPYAAARDGSFFRSFGVLHAKGRFPARSLLWLGGTAVVFCVFSLADVIAGLVVLRILIQFLAQHVGLIWMRRWAPERLRPFRMWLYPLPPVIALAGFTYILLGRKNFKPELIMAVVVLLVGALIYRLIPANSPRMEG